jgi:transcriptional regulator with XRE-family HTH domain
MAVGDVGTRVRMAREQYPGRMRIIDLARALGIDHGRLSNWERGKHDPPYDMVLKIAEALGVSVDWLLGEKVPMKPASAEKNKPVFRSGVRFIPVYGSISAGNPGHNVNDAIEWYEMREWGGEFERWGRIIDGWSMEPVLQAGDLAIFEDRGWEIGHVVHAYRDGEDTIKQVKKVDGRLHLCPTNADYDPIDGEGWHIRGVCIAYVRKESDGSTTLREYPHGMRPKL